MAASTTDSKNAAKSSKASGRVEVTGAVVSKATLDGAQALVKGLEKQGVEYIWGLSGGAAIPIFDAIVTTKTKIKLVLVRHEQGATHIADGYARVTGKPGVVLVTSGPGATNTVTGILTAHMDSVPMVVITGQTISPMLGKDAFQEADVFGITMPVVKHSYLIKKTNDIPRIVKEAFHIANTGRPGPVLMDIPKDISSGAFTGDLDPAMDLPGYNPVIPIDKDKIKVMAAALSKSKRPVLLVGHGVLISRAWDAVRRLAETLQAPVTTTLLGKGAFPESHPLSLGMLGMHGTAYANKAMVDCDLVLSIGSRYDDRIIGQAGRFCREAVRMHIDVDASEINKMINVHHYCVGDAGEVMDGTHAPGEQAGHRGLAQHAGRLQEEVPAQVQEAGRAQDAAHPARVGQDDRRQGHHCHRRGPAPDVVGPVQSHRAAGRLAQFGRGGHHGLRLSGRHRGPVCQAQGSGVGHRG
jgi:thiamine pyrophosphate-dependent acetolactate synthase large subunit-like protein